MVLMQYSKLNLQTLRNHILMYVDLDFARNELQPSANATYRISTLCTM